MNESVISKTSEYFKKKGVILPKVSELCNPHSINEDVKNKLKTVDKDSIDPLNLFLIFSSIESGLHSFEILGNIIPLLLKYSEVLLITDSFIIISYASIYALQAC